jgi:hypothetical protein
MANNCEDCFDRSVEIPVGPTGANGSTGAQGPAGTNGTNGTNGTTELITLWSNKNVNSTSYTTMYNTAITIPALTWSSIGTVLRIHLVGIGDILNHSPFPSLYWNYDYKIRIGGVDIPLPNGIVGLGASSITANNGFTATIDISCVVYSATTPSLISEIRTFTQGGGDIDSSIGGNGYIVLPFNKITSNIALGNPYDSAQYITTINQASAMSFEILGKRTASSGSPTGTPSIFLPMLKVELLKK